MGEEDQRHNVLLYFGSWGDPDAAEEKYKRERDDLAAGRIPRDRQPGGCTVQTTCEKFLAQKRRGLATGEISQRSIDDYERTCAEITCSLSENRLGEDLTPDDFARLPGEMAENYGALRLGNEVVRIRCVFKFAFDWGLIATPVRYGGGFDKGHAITRHEDNKGGRDEQVLLHQTVVEHLRTVVDFGPVVFPWPKNRRCLYEEFARIQTAAGIDLPCPEKHKHTDACHRYGFHDLRRAFATMNADRLTGDALQALMRHKSYSTTQRYINIARQLDQSVADLYVPNVERKKAAV